MNNEEVHEFGLQCNGIGSAAELVLGEGERKEEDIMEGMGVKPTFTFDCDFLVFVCAGI